MPYVCIECLHHDSHAPTCPRTPPKHHNCSRNPPCADREQMRDEHGSPFMFQRAVTQAADDGYCSYEQAEAASGAYRCAWELGSCVTPTPTERQPK
jgi:hypothetical protein